MTRIMLTCTFASVLLLQACVEVDNDPRFGDAVRNNINAQIANPNAPTAEPMTAEGAKAAGAQKRYDTDTVKKPEDVTTKSNGSGSSASSGGN